MAILVTIHSDILQIEYFGFSSQNYFLEGNALLAQKPSNSQKKDTFLQTTTMLCLGLSNIKTRADLCLIL